MRLDAVTLDSVDDTCGTEGKEWPKKSPANETLAVQTGGMADTTQAASVGGRTRSEVVRRVLERVTPPVTICNPTARTVRAASLALDGSTAQRSAVVARYEALRQIRDTFEVAATLAERTADGLTLGVLTDPPETALVVGRDRYYALVRTDESVTAIPSTAEFPAVRAYTRRLVNESESFPLRTPPLSVIRSTMREEFGDGFLKTFDAALDPFGDLSMSTPVTVPDLLLALAARHELLLYDLSKWGEDVGIASRATFSRRKTRLEDAGLIGAEEAPTEFGRPRHRLHAADPVLDTTPPDRLVGLLGSATD